MSQQQMMHSKHFTLEEAQELLSEVKEKVQKMADLKQKTDRLGYNVYRHHFFSGKPANGEKYHPKELEIIRIIEDLQAVGIQVKGIENGLIDFPSIRANEEEVYLCWCLDEDNILYWHRIPDGFQGRRPIDTL
jgi:hypothetical protein